MDICRTKFVHIFGNLWGGGGGGGILGKNKKKFTEGKKPAGQAKQPPSPHTPPPLAQGLDPPLRRAKYGSRSF